MNTCAREGCDETYRKKTHNQKYHNDECCRLATNQRIMQKYYARRDQRAGKPRLCKSCEKTQLSRYNDGEFCSPCKAQRQVNANAALALALMNTSLVS